MKTLEIQVTKNGFTVTDEIMEALFQGEDVILRSSKPEMVELEGGDFWFNTRGGKVFKQWTSPLEREAGAERATKELAERSAKRMVRSNRLDALSLQIDPDYEGWVDGDLDYSIYKYDGEWDIQAHSFRWNPDRVYMTKETAETICDLLNSKRFIL